MRKAIVMLAAVMCPLVLCQGCRTGDLVAEGRGFAMSADDLRMEVLNLGPTYSWTDTFEGRKALVEAIASRILVAGEAEQMPYIKADLERVEASARRTAVGEAYRMWKVEKSVRVPRLETKPLFDKLDRRLNLRVLTFAVYEIADSALAEIRAGGGFDAVAGDVSGRADVQVRDLGWKLWRELDRSTANVIYWLDVGQVSGIIRGRNGYDIFYLVEDAPLGAQQELIYLRSKRFLRALKEQELAQVERQELSSRYNVEFADNGLLAALQCFAAAFAGGRPPDPLLNQVVATYEDGQVMVADIYNAFFALPAASQPYVGDFHAIKEFCLDLILPDLEARAGESLGLGRLPEVIWKVRRAREDFLIPVMEEDFRGQVDATEEDIAEYYRRRSSDLATAKTYRVSRILLESEDEAERVLAEIRAGTDFAKVAAEKSRDRYSAQKGGDLGLINAGMIAQYDSVVAGLSIGQTSDPFVSTQGVELLRLDEVTLPRQLTLEEARPAIEGFIVNSRANELLAAWVSNRQRDIGFTVNETILRQIALPEPRYRRTAAQPAGSQEKEG